MTHGAGLAILTPNWMEYVLSDKTVDKFAEYGVNVFGIDAAKDRYDIAKEAIAKTKEFLVSLGLPMSLKDLGIADESNFEAMAEKAVARTSIGFVSLNKEDVVQILKMCM